MAIHVPLRFRSIILRFWLLLFAIASFAQTEPPVPSELSAPNWLADRTLDALAGIPSDAALLEPQLTETIKRGISASPSPKPFNDEASQPNLYNPRLTQPFIHISLIQIALEEPSSTGQYDYDFILISDLWDFFPEALSSLNQSNQFLLVANRQQALTALKRGKANKVIDIDVSFASHLQDMITQGVLAMPSRLLIQDFTPEEPIETRQYYSFELPDADPVLRETINRRLTRLLYSNLPREYAVGLLPLLFGEGDPSLLSWSSQNPFSPYF